MLTTNGPGGRRSFNRFTQFFIDQSKTVFQISTVALIVLLVYLLYGLFSGTLANTPKMSTEDQTRVMGLIATAGLWLNVSAVAMMISGGLLYSEENAFGVVVLIVAAVLLYGFQFIIQFVVGRNASQITAGPASKAVLADIIMVGYIFGVAAGILVVRQVLVSILSGNAGIKSRGKLAYGKDAHKDTAEGSLLGALAKCWQLPYCREGIRKTCPIYHARTKCWQQRVGCMCEQDILRYSMEGSQEKTAEPSVGPGGFVPIGDLMTKQSTEVRRLPMRRGPRGVMLPDNPNLSGAQKRERCRNCVIYNEHERLKYQMLAPLVTLAVPLLVFLNFPTVREMMNGLMDVLDKVLQTVSFNHMAEGVFKNVPEAAILMLILVGTVLTMTWLLQVLEYCVFRLKI